MDHTKKVLIPAICIIAAWFVPIPHSLADEASFKLAISGSDLKVMTIKGGLITTIPVSTIGQTVEVSPVSFQISFGSDEHGNLSAIVSADPKHPSGLGFEVFGRRVDSDKDSIVIITFSKDLKQVTIEPGCLGGVQVDGKILAKPSTLVNTPPTAVASTTDSKTEPSSSIAPSVTIAQSDMPVYDSSPESPSITLAADFKSRNPDVLLVSLDPAKPLTQQQIGEMMAAKQIALKQLFWAEPVTPPEGVQAVTVAVGSTEVRLAEVKGSVSVVSAQGQSSPAKNGIEVAATSKLVTGDNSSVAVMIGGINSIRLASGTTAMVSLNMEGLINKKTTLIDLKEGTLFCKVGYRELDIQDFKVKTPNGMVITHGTDFSTTFKEGRTTIICVQGIVEVMDSLGNYLGTTAPRVEHSVGCLAFGQKTPPAQLLHDLLSTLALASQFNAKINGILDRLAAGQTCTPLELDYLKRVSMVDLAIKPDNENAPLLLNRQMPAPSVIETIAPSPDSQSAANIKPQSDSSSPSPADPPPVSLVITGHSQNPLLNNPDPPLATPY